MERTSLPDPITLTIGDLPRAKLMEALTDADVHLNESAETLLNDEAFDHPDPQKVRLVERSVAELGLRSGGSLSDILRAVELDGLELCPPVTGPYLRLVLRHQGNAPDSVLSVGTAPSASLTIGSAPISADDEYPKGFYLRVIDEALWLRGYRCTDEHTWDPDDRFALRVPKDEGVRP